MYNIELKGSLMSKDPLMFLISTTPWCSGTAVLCDNTVGKGSAPGSSRRAFLGVFEMTVIQYPTKVVMRKTPWRPFDLYIYLFEYNYYDNNNHDN